MIRHAGSVPPLPVGSLTVSMIEPSFDTLLMTEVCSASLLAAPFDAAEIAAILLSAITMSAEPKDNAAILSPTKPLTQNEFACMLHSRPKARLDISGRSWQLSAICFVQPLN